MMSSQGNCVNVQQYQNCYNLPQELLVKPLALVGFSGLDVINNAVHKAVWEAFTNRVEKAPVAYKLISNTYKFPVFKPKRTSYDWYIPKGILKRNWMLKHLDEVPSVIVIFYDLDWNDSQWNEKMIECGSRVQSMRVALESRECRIILVLIQNALPIPDDPIAAERAVALCSSCDLSSQSLYVLPHGQHTMGYTIRLENTFFEFCQGYYHNTIKNVKSHKEYLNKNSHLYLFVRHQFKMGFLSEMKQDIHTAHKHYTLAYNNLLDIRIVDTNALEIRTVAGFINYKLCRLMFILNLPRDAISQFKMHIDKFKSRLGFQELSFEHFAWLSKQFEVFGDVFDEAVKSGLPAVQTLHPGIYYHQAADYAICRKKFCQELCSSVTSYPDPDPLEGLDKMEFFGQRPWRPGKISSEPPDPTVEASGIQAMQFLETLVQHSSIIINLYGSAIAQYKIYKCPRMRRNLVLQMADECTDARDFGKALTLLTHMLADYREEKWWQIISNVLEKAIRCAFLTASVQDYIVLAFEILGSNVTTSLEDKRRIYENLNRILKKQIPYGDPSLPSDILQNSIIIWQPVLATDLLNFELDMENKIMCVLTKARFIKTKYEIDHKVALEIFVRSTCPFPLTFLKILVNIKTPSQNPEFLVADLKNKSLQFQPNEVKRFLVEFEPNAADINQEIQVDCITLQIGSSTSCLVNLKFNGAGLPIDDPELHHFKICRALIDFDNLRPILQAKIIPRSSKIGVKFKHQQPSLIGECYKVDIVLSNDEICGIKNLKVEFGTPDESDVEISSQSPTQKEKLPLLLETPNCLKIGESTVSKVFIKAPEEGIRSLQVYITYHLDTDKPHFSVKTEKIILSVVKPFEVETKFYSTLQNEINKFYAHEEFGVMTLMRFLSPWPIEIENTHLEFRHPIKSFENEIQESQLKKSVFNNEEVANELYLAVCEKMSDQNVTIGDYTIKWKRLNGELTTTTTTLTGYPCDWIPLNLKLSLPKHGFVRTPCLVTYNFVNHSPHLVQLDVGMEASEAFMFAGYRQVSISVHPHSSKAMPYNLYPLVAGSVSLPRLNLKIPDNNTEGPALRQDQLNQLIERTIPPSIYVMPQMKGNPKLPDIVHAQQLTAVN